MSSAPEAISFFFFILAILCAYIALGVMDDPKGLIAVIAGMFCTLLAVFFLAVQVDALDAENARLKSQVSGPAPVCVTLSPGLALCQQP